MSDNLQAQQILDAYKRQEAEKLSKRMSKMGRSRSKKKLKAGRRNVKKAQAALKRKLRDPEWRAKRYGSKA